MWAAVVPWLRGETGPLPLDPDQVTWLCTSKLGRGVALLVISGFAAIAWYVKFSGIREQGGVDSPTIRWILGWAPSLLATAGLPFLYPAFGMRPFHKAIAGVPFLAECLWMCVIVLVLEVEDLWEPSETFSSWDIVAAIAGAAVAFLLFRTLVQRRTQVSATA